MVRERAFMTQNEVELILMRQLASYMATAFFVVNSEGDLLYYNEAAEGLLGRRYVENGAMPLSEWSKAFQAADDDGRPLPPEELPLVVASTQRRATHKGPFRITGLDGVVRRIAVTAFPLEGQQGRHLGAVAILWEVDAQRD
jgi:PAS domain-containing protein